MSAASVSLLERFALSMGESPVEKAIQSNAIHASRAYLCQDCDFIGDNSRNCAHCSSGALMGIAGILNPTTERETAPTQSLAYSRR